MAKFNVADAKSRFSELIQKAMMGEEVIIAKDNKPVVKLVPIVKSGKARIPGSAKGQSNAHDRARASGRRHDGSAHPGSERAS